MGFKMEITDGEGRRFNSLADAFSSEIDGMLENTYKKVEASIRAERCPIHNQTPSVKRQRNGSHMVFQFEACCDKAKAQAESAASRAMNG
jgi:hypothetical protein